MPQFRDMLNYYAPIACLVGLAHVVFLVVTSWNAPSSAYELLHAAGGVWLSGESPYGMTFDGAIWARSPNWFPLTALFAMVEPLAGARGWLIVNASLLIGASALNAAVFQHMLSRTTLIERASFADLLNSLTPLSFFFFHAGFMGLAFAAGAIQLGPPVMLVYFGASLLIWAATKKRDIVGGVGLALILLSPSYGLLAAAALAHSAYGRRVIALGAIVTFLLAVPALMITPAADIIAAMLHASQATDLITHSADNVSGIRQLLIVVGGPDLGAAFYVVLALAVICAAGLFGRQSKPSLRTIDNLMVALSVTLFIAPPFDQYFVLIGAMLFYAVALRAPLNGLTAMAFLIIWRAENLPAPDMVGDASAFYSTLGALLIFIAMLASMLRIRVPNFKFSIWDSAVPLKASRESSSRA